MRANHGFQIASATPDEHDFGPNADLRRIRYNAQRREQNELGNEQVALLVKTVSEVTRIIEATEAGDPNSASQLFPIVYDELRRLAAQQLSHERPGQTLQSTALVHEAYIRLVDVENSQHWQNRRHFFAAAAEAMRRILINRAREKKRLKRGGDRERVNLDQIEAALDTNSEQLLELDEALDDLAAEDAHCAQLVKLRFFAGFTLREAAEVMGLAQRTAEREWAYARAWLLDKLSSDDNLSS